MPHDGTKQYDVVVVQLVCCHVSWHRVAGLGGGGGRRKASKTGTSLEMESWKSWVVSQAAGVAKGWDEYADAKEDMEE